MKLLLLLSISNNSYLVCLTDPCPKVKLPECRPTGLTIMSRCQAIVSRIAWVGNAAKYCHFRWPAFRSVGIKAVTGCTCECWHSARSFSFSRLAIPPTGRVWPNWPKFFLTGQNGRTGLATARPLNPGVLPLRSFNITATGNYSVSASFLPDLVYRQQLLKVSAEAFSKLQEFSKLQFQNLDNSSAALRELMTLPKNASEFAPVLKNKSRHLWLLLCSF